MGAMASQITGILIVYSIVCSRADQRKHQSSALLAFVGGIHQGPVNSPHKGPTIGTMFPFDDVIMWDLCKSLQWGHNGRNGVSNHRYLDCLFNHLFKSRSKKTPKLRVTGLCEGNSPVTGEFPHKGPATRPMFPFDDVIMSKEWWQIGVKNDVIKRHFEMLKLLANSNQYFDRVNLYLISCLALRHGLIHYTHEKV